MLSLVEKIRSVGPIEPGERILCTAVRRGDRRLARSLERSGTPPRSEFMSAGAWRRIRDRFDLRRSMGVVIAYRFELLGQDGAPLAFELAQKKDASAFREALARRLAQRV